MAELTIGELRARVWVLFAIDACDRAGLTPIPKQRFHTLVFLSNCLARLFSTTPPSERILHYKRGPYYPDVQWQLDRLVAMGCVRPTDLSLEPDRFGPWLTATYDITPGGTSIVEQCRLTPLGSAVGSYVDELVFAFSRLNLREVDDIGLRELNWAASDLGDLISFGTSEDNLAVQKAAEFERLVPELLTRRFREQLQLYLRYIQRSEKAA
jgi:hypothetical protein